MEDAEMTKEWFVTHEGKQFGPVSIDDLKYEAERGKLNPRLDMVWRKDMDDWIPAGDLEGLFEKNEEAEAEEKKKAETVTSEFQPEDSKEDKLRLQGKWDGATRATFLFVSLILPILLFVGIGFATPFFEETPNADLVGPIIGGIVLLYSLFSLWITISRFTNLSMSRWWFLSLFVPILSIWTYSRLFSCPAGYAEHKKLDTVGWILAIVFWLFVLATIALLVATIIAVSQAPVNIEKIKTTEDFLEILKKTYAPK